MIERLVSGVGEAVPVAEVVSPALLVDVDAESRQSPDAVGLPCGHLRERQLVVGWGLVPATEGIDDIFDTGRTLSGLLDSLVESKPASLRSAVLAIWAFVAIAAFLSTQDEAGLFAISAAYGLGYAALRARESLDLLIGRSELARGERLEDDGRVARPSGAG